MLALSLLLLLLLLLNKARKKGKGFDHYYLDVLDLKKLAENFILSLQMLHESFPTSSYV